MDFKKEPYARWTNDSNKTSYLFYKTKDDSISISLNWENEGTELMHSVDGAFSETIYLYEDIVKYVYSQTNISNSCFLSLGLGLGYIEMLVCAFTLQHFPNKKFTIYSFEKENELRLFFKKFIFEEEIPLVFKDAYNHILKLFSQNYNLNSNALKTELKNRIHKNDIILYEEYNLQTQLPDAVHGLFFDAFSINTSPELWEDKLIEKILNSSAPVATFATYAARTQLKKLLLKHGFKLEKKKGYGGKKESTFAWKD